MSSESGKITTFRDLNSWQAAYSLSLFIYTYTKDFPPSEQYGLTSQLRRAVVSVSSNIAEGFSRNTYKDKLQFYSVALGSLSEVESQMLVAKGLGFVSEEIFARFTVLSDEVSKLLHGLIKSTKAKV